MSLIRLLLIAYGLVLALTLAGCGRGSEKENAAGTTGSARARAEAEPEIYGRWRITAVNGSAPLQLDRANESRPYLSFSRSRYSGSRGCNSFGGTGLAVGRRWFGEPPIATQQGCGHLTAQEQASMGIASSGPAITFQGAMEAALASEAGSLRLRREARPEPATFDPALMLLVGSSWQVGSIDGRPVGELTRRDRARLSFDADSWKLDAGCSRMTGRWRQAGQAVTMEISSKQPSGCNAYLKAEDDAIRAMIAAGPRYVVGPNRELVMGGGDHWLTGWIDPANGREAAAALLGEWRVESVDGTAPKAMSRPPSLIFGRSSYAVWDGCNHSEGVMLVVGGQLFTHGSGVSTLASCMPDPKRGRVPAIVASNPKVARMEGGGIALVAPSGTLRLARLSSQQFGSLEQIGLREPRTIALSNPSGRLVLQAGGKFTVELQCGKLEGQWRSGQPARFSADRGEGGAPACDWSPGSEASRLRRFFTGNVLAVTGPNRDIVLLVNHDRSVAGRASE